MNNLILIFILAIAVLLRIPYLIYWDIFYGSDYALVGLVGKHFVNHEYSLYLWGQGYHGNLEPLLLSFLFRVFGSTPFVATFLPFIFSIVFLGLYYKYICKTCDQWSATISTLILAVPSPFFISLSMRNTNYIEILIFGLVHFFLFRRLIIHKEKNVPLFFLFGLTAGFCWFYLKLILLFWLALAIYWVLTKLDGPRMSKLKELARETSPRTFFERILLLRKVDLPSGLKKILMVVNFYNCANFLVACFLWINGSWVSQVGSITVKLHFWPIFKSSLQMTFAVAAICFWKELYQKARSVLSDRCGKLWVSGFVLGYSPALIGILIGQPPDSRTGVANFPELMRNLRLVSADLIPSLTGAHPITFISNFSMLVTAVSLVFLIFQLITLVRDQIKEKKVLPEYYPILSLFLATFMVNLTYDRLTDSSAIRYFAPIYLSIPLGLALILKKVSRPGRFLAWGILALYLTSNLFANIQVWKSRVTPNPYEKVVSYLVEKNIKGGYAHYGLSYYFTFLSDEKTIIVPAGPEEKYPAYTEYVRSLDEAVLLDYPLPPETKEITVKGTQYKITHQETVGNFPIVYLKKL